MATLLAFGGSLAGKHSCFRRGAAPCPSAHPASAVKRSNLRVARVVAAEEAAPAEKRKPTKAAEFRSLDDSQIDEEVQKSKRELFNLRIAQRTKQPFKPSDFTYHQVKIAQLLTVKREKEISEKGIILRDARKAERKQKVAMGFGNF